MPSAKTSTNDKDKNDVSEDVSLDNVESEVTSFLENCSSASIMDYFSAKISTNDSFLGNRSQDSQVVMENRNCASFTNILCGRTSRRKLSIQFETVISFEILEMFSQIDRDKKKDY